MCSHESIDISNIDKVILHTEKPIEISSENLSVDSTEEHQNRKQFTLTWDKYGNAIIDVS